MATFTSPNHQQHTTTWIITQSHNQHVQGQCLACIVDLMESTNVSTVQRQMCLSLLLSEVHENEAVVQTLALNVPECYHIICIITEMSTEDPHRQTAVSLCALLIHKLQDENLYQNFVDKFHDLVLSNPTEKQIWFYFLVLGKLCDMSQMYSKLIVSSHASSICSVLDIHQHLDTSTLTSLVHLLEHLVQAVAISNWQESEGMELFIWKIMDSLVIWLNTVNSLDLQVHCSALLKTCVKSEDMIAGLLLVGHDGHTCHTLLMGLKRCLMTKEPALVLSSTQCLTLIMETLTDVSQIQEVLDTDLAEFVFEFLHTTNTSQLEWTFQCLYTMAQHQIFYDKCHAVYGLDSTLKALREVLDSRNSVIIEKGLIFLSCLMERQPGNMPLFVNQSWTTCAQILQDSLLQDKPGLFLLALKAVVAFFRPQHQQSPVLVKHVSLLLQIVKDVSECQIQKCLRSTKKETAWVILACINNISNAIHRLLLSDTILCGNEHGQVQQLESLLRSMCESWMSTVINDLMLPLTDAQRFDQLLSCLDILLTTGEDQSTATSISLMARGLPYQMLTLVSSLQLTDNFQQHFSCTMASLCIKLTSLVNPNIQVTEKTLAAGFIQLQCKSCTSTVLANCLSRHEEIIALFTLLYLSYLHGYRCWKDSDMMNFLVNILKEMPELISFDTIVIRAYVYLEAVCKLNLVTDTTHTNDEDKLLMAQLNKLPVDVWFTDDIRVMKWSLLTEEKSACLGIKLVEYWLLNIAMTTDAPTIPWFNERNRCFIEGMATNINFLISLAKLLDIDTVSTTARDILIYCVSHFSVNPGSLRLVPVLKTLLTLVLCNFTSILLQTARISDSTTKSYLMIMSSLLESPLCSAIEKTSCLKTVYQVIKLVTKMSATSDVMTHALTFLKAVIEGLSGQDSKTVISVMMQNETFVSALETSVESSDLNISQPALVIVAWLATHGSQYQTTRPIVIQAQLLLSSLASYEASRCLPILQLLNFALSDICDGLRPCGAVTFVKTQPNAITSRAFSLTELKQIYVYLQQLAVQQTARLRIEAVVCIRRLVSVGQAIGEHVLSQPWNHLMLQSILTSCQEGLTGVELELCYMFASKDQELWNKIIPDNFLIDLLNSDLSQVQQVKAVQLIQQIKESKCAVDTELLSTAEKYITSLSEH